jgi:hypothetical protein
MDGIGLLLIVYRAKLMNNPDVGMTESISNRVATLTEGFSYAYIKELFVGCLLTMVQNKTSGHDGIQVGLAHGDLSSFLEKHIAVLRDEMSENPVEAG